MAHKLWALALMIVFVSLATACGGGGSTTTTTTTITTPDSSAIDPAISYTLNAFEPDSEGDLISQVVRANGVAVEDGDIITVDKTRPTLHVATAIYGFGVYDPETEDRLPVLNITDVEVEGQNLCEIGISYDTVHGVILNPTNTGEINHEIDLSSYQKADREVRIQVTVTGRADPNLAVVWTAKRMGLRPMPSSGQTTITTTTVTKKDNDSWLTAVVGVVGLVVGLWTGNPGLGIAIACGDPVVTTTFTVVVPASGGGGVIPPPPPANKPPTAVLVASPVTGEAPLLVTLNASGSYDPDGTIVRYEWDFDGDGIYDSDGTGAGATHPYYQVGTFVPRVRVTDDDGEMDVAVANTSVTVTSPTQNQPPMAKLQASPTTGEAPLAVTLDASASYDVDGAIVMYQWDTDGDGDLDIDGTLPSIVIDYPVGTWTPRVCVVDDGGKTDTATASSAIVVTEPPVDPYAGATVFVTPQDIVLDRGAGDEQQFVCRIYAADGLTELPVPTGGFIAWSCDAPGAITSGGYLYSIYLTGSTVVYATVHWPDGVRMLTGSTWVHLAN